MSAITITLDDGNSHVYAPGDRVAGTVTYLVRSVSNEIKDISIEFVGDIITRVKSAVTPASHFAEGWSGVEEKMPVLRSKQRLMKGPYSVRPQKLTHKFSFVIPKEYTPQKSDQLATSFVSPYVPDKLPPSLDSGSKSIYSSANVVYKLKATVEEGKNRKTERAELPITIANFATAPAKKPQSFRFKFPLEKWSSLRANGTRLSLKQKLSHIAHMDAPAIAIDGRLHIPEELSATYNFPIKFSARQIREKETDPLSPILKLKTITLTLYSFTELVCWFPHSRPTPQSIGHTHKEELGSKTYTHFGRDAGKLMPLDGTSVEIAHNWSLENFAAPTRVVSDFTSAITRHWHSVHAHVELLHEASNHHMKMNIEVPVKVIPPFDQSRSPAYSPPAITLSPPPRLSSDSHEEHYQDLPAYTPSPVPTPPRSPAPDHKIKRKSIEGAALQGAPPSYPGRPMFVPSTAPAPMTAPEPIQAPVPYSGKVLRVINP